MRSNRVITIAIVFGVVIVGVTFLGASRIVGDEKGGDKSGQKVLSPVKNGSRGVVVFGNVDVDNGVGLLPIFPEGFPQPCKVKQVFKFEGDPVEPGDILVEFDSELADTKVAQAQIGIAMAKAAEKRYETLVEQATEAEKANAIAAIAQSIMINGKQTEVEAARIELKSKKDKLGMIGVMMDADVDAAEKKLEAKLDELSFERKKLEIIEKFNPAAKKKPEAVAGVAEAKAKVALQEEQLKEALYGKKLMTLRSPVAGRVVRSGTTEGMTFGAQTRQPAFLIQTKGPIIVRAEVDQEFAARVAKGQDAIITDDGDPSLKWSGKVTRVADSFLPKRGNAGPEGLLLNDTRVLECIISIDAGTSNTPVRVGQRVKVSIGVE